MKLFYSANISWRLKLPEFIIKYLRLCRMHCVTSWNNDINVKNSRNDVKVHQGFFPILRCKYDEVGSRRGGGGCNRVERSSAVKRDRLRQLDNLQIGIIQRDLSRSVHLFLILILGKRAPSAFIKFPPAGSTDCTFNLNPE